MTPSPLPLRFALGLAAVALLVLALFGAVQSVKINWQFGLTLAPAAQAPIIAGLLAAIELLRIGMPFAAKGMELAGLPNKHARTAFWLFTAVSVLSAGGYFKMNRDAAGEQRTTQMSFSAGYKSELRDITTRLKHEITRSAAEIDAEIKALSRAEVAKRAELEAEKAAIEQRPKDLKRLDELQALDVWKTVVTGKDVQAAMIAELLPVQDREAAQRWIAGGLIILVILAIEFAVGRTPFTAVMILAWACRRQERLPPAQAEPAPVAAPPADHVSRFVARCIVRAGAIQFRPLYESYLNFCVSKGWQPLSEFHFKPAMHRALGAAPETEKRKPGIFWLGLSVRPELMMGGARAAA